MSTGREKTDMANAGRGVWKLPGRRRFLLDLARAAVLVAVVPESLRGRERFGHPEPRPEIDGADVLQAPDVLPRVADLFDGIRQIPDIADGIGCHCGCGAMPEMRSLLSCYEGIGMAQFCVICEGEGRIAVSMRAEGHTLDEIRAAIDRRFG